MNDIVTVSRDEDTRVKIGKHGPWMIRARQRGVAFDLASLPFSDWDSSVHIDLTLEQTARMLGVGRGDLYAWAIG